MRRSTLSPAMVVALIALFVALGGTSYAAITALPKNSVGTRQIKNGAVTAAKISPSGLGATTMVVGAAGAPAYLGTWEAATGGGDQGAFFYKDPWRIVHIQGNAETTGAATTGTVFMLPAGYRPAGDLWFAVYGGAGSDAYIEITASGTVNVVGVAQDYVGLSNITFRAVPVRG